MISLFNKIFYRYGIILIIALFIVIASAGIFYNYSLFNTAGDEAPLMTAALKMIADHTLRPNYPSFYHLPLAVYLYLPVFVITLALFRWLGIFTSLEAIKQFGQIDFAKLLPLARFISVIISALSVYLLYKICQKIFKNNFIALLASFFLSTSLIFVQTSHFARVWLPHILAVLIAFYFIIDLFLSEKSTIRQYLLIGLSVGLAFGTHLIGVLIYVPFLVAHYLKNVSHSLAKIFILNKKFWLANLLFIVIYFLVYFLNTYGFVHYVGGILPNFNKMFPATEAINQSIGPTTNQGSEFIATFIYYGQALFQYEPILLLFGLVGLLVLYYKNRKLFFIIFSFVLVYYLAISALNMRIARYLILLIPFLSIAAAYGFYFIYTKLNRKIAPIILVLLCLLLLFPPLLWDYKFILPSTRLETADWIYRNISAGESIVNFDANLELNENRQALEDIAKYSDFLTKKRAYLLSIDDKNFPWPNYYVLPYYHYEQLPEEILNKKFNYLVVNWYNYSELEESLKLLAPFQKIKKPVLIKRFPDTAGSQSIAMDLAANMDNPLVNLLKIKQNGPIIDIYKLQ